ncbi:glycosyltransferase family 4 protein [Alkalihalobacterium elongatum]|uniref:glycosyltransferase family 4 protein n=1 Tax=Alkalihalobacterium elongatum TaxID=2675466 RepID=UPI001C1FC61A|nr:glycosyltransferase family 4 protein [Alkalihalobacterium elongatum]
MKILYISSSIVPSNNANSVHVMKMCNALAKNGHEVTLIATKGSEVQEPYGYYNVSPIFKLVLVPQGKFGLSPILRILKAILLKMKGVDLIYTRWPLASFTFSKLSNNKMIIEYHGKPSSKLNEYFIRKSLEARPKNIFNTSSLRSYFLSNLPRLEQLNTMVLHNGADSVVKQKKFPNSSINCGYVGSFKKGKGVDTVVKIAEKLPEIQFHIVGGTKQEIKEMKAQTIAKNIIWYGFLPQGEISRVMEKIDISLLPNHPNVYVDTKNKNDIGDVTSPIKVFEYMSYGKVIIASDLPVIKEVLKHEYNALLVKHDDIEGWKEQIIKVITNEELRLNLSEIALKDFNENYTWEIRAKKALEDI